MAIIWDVKTQDAQLVRQLSEECGLSSVVIKLLINRGFTSASAIKDFLNDKDSFIEPELLPDIDKAVAERWLINPDWRLIAQMPFGAPLDSPAHRTTSTPLHERRIVYSDTEII